MGENAEHKYDDSKADTWAAVVVLICILLIALQFVSGGQLLSMIGNLFGA